MVEWEMGDCLVYELAALALLINVNPFYHNPPIEDHSQYIRDGVASLSIYCKISMIVSSRNIRAAPY
jgi:hypothetical protein